MAQTVTADSHRCADGICLVYAKAKNVQIANKAPEDAGDVWTWMAIEADTRFVPSWHIGSRDGDAVRWFVADLAARLANRVQITRDGHKAYLEAIEESFGADVDYAMLLKLYGPSVEPDARAQRRYSPAECIGIQKNRIEGSPDPNHISTSYTERQNLTMRMS